MRGTALALLALACAPAARADAPPCGDGLGIARSNLLHNQVAKQPTRVAAQRAKDAWASVPPACRDAQWYVLAANLLRHVSHGEPLAAGDTGFASARDALAAGLAAAPHDPDLLAYAAYLARIKPEAAPPLPTDACAGAAGWSAAYVCAELAVAEGRRAEAARALASFADARVPDLAELRTLAHAPARKLAPPRLDCNPFCPAEGWRVAQRK